MKKIYTEEMKNYIACNCRGKTILQLQEEFNEKFNTNITYHAMKSYLSSHKIKVGRNNKRKFKDEHIEFLKENVKGITLKELTKRFNDKFNMNISESAVGNLKHKYNLQSGIVGGQFPKGHIPANKGKKGYMSPEQYEKCKATMFKKGNVPANARDIGSERIDKNGYILVKIQDGHKNKNWIRKHRYLYEQAYGRIPKGHKVIFADGNNRNFDLSNLILVSDAEELIMNRNKLFKNDTELTKAGVTIAKILDKVNKRKKDI